MRVDGYAQIRDYAVIGDGRTAALVARDGAIDWLCLPNFDSPSVFGAILDQQNGGTFVVQPAAPFESSRRYLPRTNILETTFTTAQGSARVTDVMVLPNTGLSPMRELARVIEGVTGTVPMQWHMTPRFNYGTGSVEYGWRSGMPVATSQNHAVGLTCWNAGKPSWSGGDAGSRFEIRAGDRALIAMAGAHAEPLILPGREACELRIAETTRFWEKWASQLQYEGRWCDAVIRSALTLKLLIFAPSGATTAAPTTSLPEELGGIRNWDYRFCWIRDSAFMFDALLQLGCRAEAQALFWWFMQATALTEPRLNVLYRLDGGADAPECELPLPGYRGSRPVRIGNAAIDQDQLDIYGDLMETAWLYARGDYRIDRDTGAVLARIADLVCRIWREPDAGIWEVRGPKQHFTHSKAMCWVALDRAIRLAAEQDVPSRHVARWREERDAIKAFIETNCWSDRLRSYTRAAGTEQLDASLLMLSLVGFSDTAGERINGTIDAVKRELRQGPLVFRYLAEDGLPGSEGCFLNCSFWLAGALARAGRIDEAGTLMEELVAAANDVGLYSEQIDPATGEFLGNFPQALVHLSLIDAALAIDAAETGGPGPQKGQV
jgi:GH15 family glucan-1,4-alpha-glucosidase